LLSRSPAFEYLRNAIVAEVTTTIRGIPQEVPLGRREGLPRSCVANLDNLHVVPIRQLGERLGAVATHRHVEIERALGYALDWAELKVL
jgi:mRNA interferase MazF